MAFWLIIIVLLVGAAALLVVPAMRQSDKSTAASRDTLNKAFYQDRLHELEQDEDQGVVTERPEMVKELQQNLLNDIPGQQDAQAKPINRWALVPGVALLVVVTLGFYLKTGGLAQVLDWQQVEAQMPELRARVSNERAQPLSMEEIARLGLGLRTALQQDDRNINDWMMLGRVGMALNNATTATQAFAHAYQLDPNSLEVRLGYAEVLTRSNDPEDNKQATQMLRKMIAEDHTNLRVLSLLAFNSFEQGDFKQAIGAWQVMLKLLPANDQRAEVIKRSIAQAKTQAGGETVKLGVNVTLSPQATNALPPQGTLVISVTDGANPVPVAVKQLPLSRFPLSFSLDDSNAMMPERLLSAQHQVKVRVRISQDGLATPQAGDWFGESALQNFSGKEQIDVQINKQVP
ncbi:Cytochrome c-type biogenesis protein CcmH precursor [Serratia quinivorans]|jgi:cytochrome c-type biogenesis protein CcmI|uniref:c-type cytochrome biogenesis protein CcmI n=1 Tax=Serratia quinivorans TaxID=137545 RepID=UPI00217AA488|nr:c-type cytochrome biogenesis protein CcmI [Serratia quinivorans]CAI0925742.1 Cytochrome c-type biogenesis protein CcmH precursor [Serratia quinivorans]CAI0929921.1 Cytochrome c-type biogenesis protein CcmH precursor [Serratia quinivorans]CAI1518537.1 Cytochrome c-type biogenesis protein CcmH precursor [Serratia quinivorans]CAI1531445.1 Cytochrome c-type biogenesis protein CcmH precursor [Serratia quinivorans]CAI1746787.1 Cytochrome c-type biogenesis protein CcmH precursor [Serratia quinivor